MSDQDLDLDLSDENNSNVESEGSSMSEVDFDDISSESMSDDDEEVPDSEEELPKNKKKVKEQKHSAWGKGKSNFYGGLENEDDAEHLEQEEAKILKEEEIKDLKEDDFNISSDEDEEEDEASKNALGLAQGSEHIERDISKLTESELKNIIKTESPELLVMLKDIQTKVTDLRNEFNVLKKNVEKDTRLTSEGVSFIELKDQLMLNYCILMTMYLLLKAEGVEVKEHPVIKQLVRTKTLMEKLTPVENLLKPQLDQLYNNNNNKSAANPLGYAPNVSNMDIDLSEEEEEEGEGEGEGATGVYKPPKLLSVEFNDDNSKQERKREQLQKRIATNSVLRDIQEEYSERPQAVLMNSTGDSQLDLEEKERRRFEENNFTRLVLSKKDRKRREAAERSLSRGSGFNELTANDGNFDNLIRDIDNDVSVRKNEEDIFQEDGLYEEAMNQQNAKKQKREEEVKQMRKNKQPSGMMVNEDYELGEGENRKATYKILKNRGLTAHRKKENRNPRVKKRSKYEKAIKRRKGQVAPMRSEAGHYGGERTGIRSDITRSRKM
ncbi:hypothetical protein WA158_005250 [Blastocystis sp. Blastoise]